MKTTDESKPGVRTAILLAAGRGSRLAPYTDTVPKPLLPYQGRPTLDMVIQALTASGVTRLMIVTHYLEDQIREFVVEHQSRTDNVDIRTVRQQNISGTANAVLEAVQAYPEWFNESYIVTATDYLVEPTFYADLVEFHNAHDKEISISLKRLPANSQSMRSSVRISHDMVISKVVEKPAPGTEPSPYTANLVFILPPTLTTYLKEITPTIRGELEIQSAINLWLTRHGLAKGLLQATPLEWQPSMASD